ncbi:protein JTB isoform X3 [Mustela lutreola]|uniref:protein JTB isoform X3 n=1 Tax=Mustela lutreola TaxID=9666 RepID=UPI002797426B|nr:protein JTB isoform X3 [Mustela lutreola]
MPAGGGRRRLPQRCRLCWLLCAFTLKLCQAEAPAPAEQLSGGWRPGPPRAPTGPERSGRLEPAVLAGRGLRGGRGVRALLPLPGREKPPLSVVPQGMWRKSHAAHLRGMNSKVAAQL